MGFIRLGLQQPKTPMKSIVKDFSELSITSTNDFKTNPFFLEKSHLKSIGAYLSPYYGSIQSTFSF